MSTALALAVLFAPSPTATAAEPAPLAALVAAPPAPQSVTYVAPRREGRPQVRFFYEEQELGSIDSDVVAPGVGVVGEIEIEDVERRRVGVEVGFGANWYVRAFSEEFLDEFDLWGGGAGVRGVAPLGANPDGPRWGIDYALGFDVSAGDADVPVVGEQDLWYTDIEGRVGASLGFDAVTVGVGTTSSWLFGEFDSLGEEGEIDGFNVGFYVGLDIHPPDFPVHGRIEGSLGDVEGVSFGLAFGF